MFLADVMAKYEDELVCDMAETYHIYNIAEHPTIMIARLVFGLRNNSRVKMKIGDVKYTDSELILALIYDKISMLLYMRTEDARRGVNRPKSLFNHMAGKNDDDVVTSETKSFKTGEEFDQKLQELRERIK